MVGNDTGGGLMQLLVTRRPERISKLVFTNCDALEVFPPWMFKPLFALGRFPLLLEAAVAPMRLAPARRLPIAFGWLTKRASSEQLARWVRPALSDREVLRDAAHFIASADPGAAAGRGAAAARVRGRGRVRLGRRRPLLPGRARAAGWPPSSATPASSRSRTPTRSCRSIGRTRSPR